MKVGRHRTSRPGLVGALLLLALFVLPLQGTAVDTPLKLLVSVEQQSITPPFAARVTLHIHNAGSGTLWLYRHVRSKLPPAMRLSDEDSSTLPTGGSVLTVNFEPASTGQVAISTPAQAEVFQTIGLPKPSLVRVAAGDDYEEKTSIRLTPAISELQQPILGAYRLTFTYSAEYSNAEEIQRDLNLAVWMGHVSSNTIEIQLQPPTPDSRCEISGQVNTPDNVPVRSAVISLTDKAGHLLDQTASDPDGDYSFSHLPPGFYWVWARRPSTEEDTAVFRHVELTTAAPSATQSFVFISQEIYEPRKMLHKPALFRVLDSAGRGLDRIGIQVTFANGNLVDDVKGETGSDGTAALELIPGRNFVTLKRRGCPKQDERADVTSGGGIGAFQFTSECTKKK